MVFLGIKKKILNLLYPGMINLENKVPRDDCLVPHERWQCVDHKSSAQPGADLTSSGALKKNHLHSWGSGENKISKYFMFFLYLPVVSQRIYAPLQITRRVFEGKHLGHEV